MRQVLILVYYYGFHILYRKYLQKCKKGHVMQYIAQCVTSI